MLTLKQAAQWSCGQPCCSTSSWCYNLCCFCLFQVGVLCLLGPTHCYVPCSGFGWRIMNITCLVPALQISGFQTDTYYLQYFIYLLHIYSIYKYFIYLLLNIHIQEVNTFYFSSVFYHLLDSWRVRVWSSTTWEWKLES